MTETVKGKKPRMTVAQLSEALNAQQEQFDERQGQFNERITELELELELATEDAGWLRLLGETEREFSREALRKIAHESRLYLMKNPLIRRSVLTTTNYCFGLGVGIKGDHPTVDKVIQKFLEDPKNKAEITTILKMQEKDKDIQVEGNLFFVFFTNNDGDTRVRTIPFDEVWEIHTNPKDSKEPWFYERRTPTQSKSELYPDWRYNPHSRPPQYKDMDVHWDRPLYHVKVNCLSDQKFGLSELYSAQVWASAYNKFLTDWATITRALAKFAWNITAKSKKTLAAAKTKLDSRISTGGYEPPPATGSTFLTGPNAELSPIKTAGTTTSAQDGRWLKLMVCAATGIFEHYYGDPATGNLATAKTMDRPMELQFKNRQRLWEEIHESICSFVIEAKARACEDGLSGREEEDAWGEQVFIYDNDTENEDVELQGLPINTHVTVHFPDLLEHDVKEHVEAIVAAATLNGNPLAGTLDAKYTTEQLLQALGETSVEEVMERLFPKGEEGEEMTPKEESLRGAIGKLRGVSGKLLEALNAPVVEE